MLDQTGKNYVFGFLDEHQVIQRTNLISLAKKWRTREGAEAWGKSYVNCGYGLTAFTAKELPN